jgi:peptidyl-prolyl cis-trans isomerase B (cyclophilin B)
VVRAKPSALRRSGGSPAPHSGTRRDREAARLKAAEEARAEAYRRAARRRGFIGVGVVVGVLLAVFGVIRAATSESERKQASTTTTAALSPTSSANVKSGPTVVVPTVAPGATVAGEGACPARDGSSPRTTKFGAPPPSCLTAGVDYTAEVRTSKGTITVDLNEDSSPGPVNDFVYLARYHYYDGLPFTNGRRAAWAEVGEPVDGAGTASPGYRQPAEGKKQKTLFTSLFVGLQATDGTTGGALVMALPGDQTTSIPPDTSPLGIILDARPDRSEGAPDNQRTVQQIINDAATSSGVPSEVITITGVDIIEGQPPAP